MIIKIMMISHHDDDHHIRFNNLCRARQASTRADFEEAFGPSLWRADPALYDYITKARLWRGRDRRRGRDR